MRNATGKLLYGALFTFVWPSALGLWSWSLDASGFIAWPVPVPPWIGWLFLLTGLALMVVAMAALVRDGGGLPMNAYPTTRFVTGSAYALMAHPIYVGFTLGVLGAAMAAGSPAGFWFAAPLSALASAALVVGYEGPKLRERFGPRPQAPIVGLPRRDEEWVAMPRRVVLCGMTLGLWAALYALFSRMPAPSGAVDLAFGFEHRLPRPDLAVWVYTLAYPYAMAAPLLLTAGRDLRRFALSAWIMTGLGYGVMLVLPGQHQPDLLAYDGFAARLMDLNRSVDAPWLDFPSFHVAWACLASACCSIRWPGLRPLWCAAAAAVAASCLLTGAHALVDLLGGFVLAFVGWRHREIWSGLVRACERLGNSLSAWRVGPMRIISHAPWSLLGAAGGTFAVLALVGSGEGPRTSALVLVGLAGAGLWGYVLEGGKRLSRPFGYFGFLIGTGTCLLALFLVEPVAGGAIMAAFAVGAPLAQAVGRARCAVQGCCHGRPARAVPGVRISHPLSRVTQLSGFACIPIHPTPLYSAVANLVLFTLLFRLWRVGAPATLIAGAYLGLSSLARFVEEQFRGEPQTPFHAGLSLYQWLSVGGFVAGLALSMAPSAPAPAPVPWSLTAVAYAVAVGIAAVFAMSVDAPRSWLPFSRLTVLAPAEAAALGVGPGAIRKDVPVSKGPDARTAFPSPGFQQTKATRLPERAVS